jgi:hypothetical protein
MNSLCLSWLRRPAVAVWLLCAGLSWADLPGAVASAWLPVSPKPTDDATRAALAGDQADLTLGAGELRAFGTKHSVPLKGDFDVVVRLETEAVPAAEGCNRRVHLLFTSAANGRAGKDQFYVGIYQKTVGELAVTGGEYRVITNLVIDSKGGRIATRPLRGVHLVADFRVVRTGADLKTFLKEGDAWLPLSQWAGGFADDVDGNFVLDNRWEARKPSAVAGRITCVSGWRVPAAAKGGSLLQALAGLDQALNAVSSAVASSSPAAPPPREQDRSASSGLDRAQQKASQALASIDAVMTPRAKPPAADAPVAARPTSVPPAPVPTSGATARAEEPVRTAPPPVAAPPPPAIASTDVAPRRAGSVAAGSPSGAGGVKPVVTPGHSPETPALAGPPLALDLKLFDQDKWQLHQRSPWSPATSPVALPRSFSIAPSVMSEGYDINHLTPGAFDGMVATALAGMKLVMGPLDPERERAMDAQWAPLFEYPCQPTLDYLRKFNPLCVQFLAAKLAYEEAAKAYDRAQADFQGAFFNDSREGLVTAAEALRTHKNILLAHSNRMTATAKAIADLGDLPNPLAHKKRARALDDEAMRIFGGFRIEPAEIIVKPGATAQFNVFIPAGLACDSVKFEHQWFKAGDPIPRKFYQPGLVVLRAEPWYQMKPVAGVEAFALATVRVDPDLAAKLYFCRKLEFRGAVVGTVRQRYEDGKGRRESEETVALCGQTGFSNLDDARPTITWEGLTFTMRTERVDPAQDRRETATVTGRLGFDGTRIETARVTSRVEFKTEAPDGMRGLELAEFELQNIPLRRAGGGRAEYGLEGPPR